VILLDTAACLSGC